MPWLPPCAVSRRSPLRPDEAFDDFDAQAERLVPHDQRSLQLTPGRCRGRVISGHSGPDVALHGALCDQALLQDIGGAKACHTLAVTRSDGAGFVANGQRFGPADLPILPPRRTLALRSPVMGGVAALAIGRDALLGHPALAPVVGEWLASLAGAGACLSRAPDLAARLRGDIRAVLALTAGPERRPRG